MMLYIYYNRVHEAAGRKRNLKTSFGGFSRLHCGGLDACTDCLVSVC